MKYATTIISTLIIIAVLIPGSNIPDVNVVGVDKIVHIIMFTLWALAVRYDFNSLSSFIVFLLGACFSFFTEVVQLMVEGRSFDLYDMIADGVGLIIGLLIGRKILH